MFNIFDRFTFNTDNTLSLDLCTNANIDSRGNKATVTREFVYERFVEKGTAGTVTQGTSRTTGVTINNRSGTITLVSGAGSTTWQSFTVTNSVVVATDVVTICQKSGTDLYEVMITAVSAGSFRVTFRTTGGTTTEQPTFNFRII